MYFVRWKCKGDLIKTRVNSSIMDKKLKRQFQYVYKENLDYVC